MKKLFAFVLACALLLPLLSGCGVSAAVASGGEYTTKLFYGVGGTKEIDNTLFSNIDSYCRINVELIGGDVRISKPGCGDDPDKIAASMKADMDSRPEGTRYLMVWGTANAFRMDPEAVIYLDKGVDRLKECFAPIMEKFYKLGGQLTGVILDLEYVGLSSYYLSKDMESDPLLFSKIVNHPNYATEVRPLLAERGFQFYPDPSDYAPEIFGVYSGSGSEYAASRTIWNRVMRIRLNQYQNEAICEAVFKYFPHALIDDYQSMDSYAWMKEVSASGEHSYLGGNNIKVGNVSNYDSYARNPVPNMMTDTGYAKPTACNQAVYWDTPFNMLLWDTNLFKNMYNATDTHLISACISAYDYNAEREGSVSNTPYYAENLFHIGLLDPQPFDLYINHEEYDSNEEYLARFRVISEILEELTRVAGYSDRTPIPLPTNWNYDFVLSGMYAGGRNIWRITPDTTGGMTKADFKTDAADPTFRINGQTVAFPGGRIIEDGKINVVGTCGYWVETASNVVPIIKCEENRYRTDPAYLEGFEGYEEGTTLTYEKLLPANVWELTDKTRESVTVVADKKGYNNNVLALKGDVSLYCTKLPANVTSADSYALDQSWELRVTMPETMPADGVIILLNTATDGGLKVTADKVYYDQNGEYVEMKDMKFVADTTYTVRRTVKLVGEEYYVCSYYVFDAKGILAGEAENVPMKKLPLPVSKIGFACENLGENTVYFDNFRLFAVGFEAEFELYEAKLGIQIPDTTAPQTGDIAYRYSWMNASGSEQKVVLVARVYDGDKMVSETPIKVLTMLPGCDGVETGIYQAGETATVLAVKSLQPQSSELTLTIFMAIAATVVIVGSVWIFSSMNKARSHQDE